MHIFDINFFRINKSVSKPRSKTSQIIAVATTFTHSPFHGFTRPANQLDRQPNSLGNQRDQTQAAEWRASRLVGCVTSLGGNSGEFPVTAGNSLKTLNNLR
jgi:hypothetical protein